MSRSVWDQPGRSATERRAAFTPLVLGAWCSPNIRKVPYNLPTELPGDRIGRYKVLLKIGEGGCGVAYMAEQDEPVCRRVALKIIKRCMDTRQVIARFEAERRRLP